jgi:glucose-6-phosphate-specific signal transduction histidine kinase
LGVAQGLLAWKTRYFVLSEITLYYFKKANVRCTLLPFLLLLLLLQMQVTTAAVVMVAAVVVMMVARGGARPEVAPGAGKRWW